MFDVQTIYRTISTIKEDTRRAHEEYKVAVVLLEDVAIIMEVKNCNAVTVTIMMKETSLLP